MIRKKGIPKEVSTLLLAGQEITLFFVATRTFPSSLLLTQGR
jgi:hypothetical protein